MNTTTLSLAAMALALGIHIWAEHKARKRNMKTLDQIITDLQAAQEKIKKNTAETQSVVDGQKALSDAVKAQQAQIDELKGQIADPAKLQALEDTSNEVSRLLDVQDGLVEDLKPADPQPTT